MRFKSFRIENFKGIRSTVLDLTKYGESKVYTLVGLNESGKTTILEALDWFGNPLQYDPNDLIPKHDEIAFSKKVTVEAEITLSPADKAEVQRYLRETFKFYGVKLPDVYTRTREWTYQDSKRVEERDFWDFEFTAYQGNQRAPRRYHKVDQAAWDGVTDFLRDEIFPPIIYYEDLLFEFPEEIYLDGLALQRYSQFEDYRAMLADVMRSIDKSYDIQKHLLDRYASPDEAEKKRISSLLVRVSAAITEAAVAEWRKIVQLSDDEAPFEIVLGPMSEDGDGHYISINVRQDDRLFSLAERSLGFRWFLAFVLFTHFRAFRDDRRGNGMFLLDEPASNLHSSAQQRLMRKFFELPNSQIMIFATHSHHLVNPEWLGSTFVVINGAISHPGIDARFSARDSDIGAVSYFEYVSQATAQSDYYQPILDALDFQPSALERNDGVVGVEGKNDFYSMLFMTRKLGLSREVMWYPGTGKGNLRQLLQLYLAWGKKCILMFDGDAQADASAIKEELGVIANNKVFTLTDLDPAWTGALESLFDVQDQESIIKAAFGDAEKISVSKKLFNAALQRLWLEGRDCKLSKETCDRFEVLVKRVGELVARSQDSASANAAGETK